MRLSFDDEESFKQAVGSLNFNNPPSDSNSFQGVASSNNMPPQEMPVNEDICFDNPSSDDPNTMLEVQRVPVGSSGSSGSTLPASQERSEDT